MLHQTIPRLRFFRLLDSQGKPLPSLTQFDPESPCDVAAEGGRSHHKTRIRRLLEFARPMRSWTPPAWSRAVHRHTDVAPAHPRHLKAVG